MKKYISALSVIALFIVFACRKDDSLLSTQICQLPREEITINQVKKTYYKSYPPNQTGYNSVGLRYYENGLLMRIDTYELPDSTLSSSYQYDYINGKPHTLSIVNSQGITHFTATFEEIDGYLMKTFTNSTVTNNTAKIVYSKNECQYLSRKTTRTNPPSEIISYYEVVDGNIVSQRDAYIDENGNEVLSDEFWEYTYYADRKNQVEQRVAYSTFDFNRNLMKSEKLCMNIDGSKVCSGSEYVYEFDESGRVVKETITDRGGGSEFVFIYE
jgi:hypothetical protein